MTIIKAITYMDTKTGRILSPEEVGDRIIQALNNTAVIFLGIMGACLAVGIGIAIYAWISDKRRQRAQERRKN